MSQNLLPFEDFLSHLQQQGFALGVDDFLQIQTLLNRLPKDCPPEKLKSLMCPLLVSNESEQVLFYKAFDLYFADLALQYVDLEEATSPTISPLQKADEELEKYHKYGEYLEWSLKGFFYQKFQTIIVSLFILLLILGSGFVCFHLQKGERIEKRSVEENQDASQEENIYTPNHQDPLKDDLAFPADSPYSNSPKKDTPQKSKDEGIGFIEFVCWLLLIFAAWIFMLHFKVKREFYLEALENIEPPQYWNIQVPKSELNLARSQAFKHAANRLQKRRLIPTQKVNIAETVEATVAAAGFPDFQYLQTSALPEYLLLIDQSSTKDQQTKWFEMWFEALKEREVIVHRFFYHGNLEWCWDEEQHYVSLAELYHRFGECRLVVIADGSQHPPNPLQRGNLYQNSPFEGGGGDVSVFADWQEKVLLSTQPLPKSVAQYLEEESGFVVLPARMESLNQLSDIFEAENPKAAKSSIYPTTAIASDLEKLNVSEQVVELKRKLTDVGFRCLCAAAMYPEMNWDLTVFLAETLYDERELLKEENMLPLVSLSYFRKGFMAEDLRRALTKELDADSKRLVKGAILHLLQLHPLVEDEYSAEFFDYQLHIALQDAQLHPQDQHKLATLKHLMEQRQFKESRYKQVVLRYMETREDDGPNLGDAFGKWFKKEDEIVEELKVEKKNQKQNVGEESIVHEYPSANTLNRFAAAFTDILVLCCASFVLVPILGQVVYIVTGEFYVPIWLGVLIVWVLWGVMDIIHLEKGEGLGKGAAKLAVIDLKANDIASSIKRFGRRLTDFVPLFFIYLIGYYWLGLSGMYTAIIPSVFFVILIVVATFMDKGRKLGDLLFGTQVVNMSDFSDAEPIDDYLYNPIPKRIYPKVDSAKKHKVLFREFSFILGFIIVVVPILYLLLSVMIDSRELIACIAIMSIGVAWAFMDIWSWKIIPKDLSNQIMIVDLKTNRQAKKWKMIVRRSLFPVVLIFIGVIVYGNKSLSTTLFILMYSFLMTRDLFRDGDRSAIDSILGTQVINVSDFEAENYEVVEPKEVVEMPINN